MDLNWELFDTLVDIGVAQVGDDHRIIRCNNSFATLFDNAAIHLKGKDVIEMTAPEDRDRARLNFETLLSGKETSVRHSKRYQRGSGETFERMLHTVLAEVSGRKCLVSFVYEYDTGDDKARIQQLDELLNEVLGLMGGKVHINMTQMNDRSQRANSGGGNILQTQGMGDRTVVALLAFIAVMIVAAFMYWLGRQSDEGRYREPATVESRLEK